MLSQAFIHSKPNLLVYSYSRLILRIFTIKEYFDFQMLSEAFIASKPNLGPIRSITAFKIVAAFSFSIGYNVTIHVFPFYILNVIILRNTNFAYIYDQKQHV